jgi:L-threonylcarbamoyladenylate synthase
MEKDYEEDIAGCLEVLRKGGVILYPTDTVWGLGCDATDPIAVERIFSIKCRPGNKALIVLLGDLRDINRYVAAPPPEATDYLENDPRPTTVIYPQAIGLAENLTGEDGTVAIRVVRDDFCRHLVKRLRNPLVSTSANFSGQPSPAIFSEIHAGIRESVDYVVRYRQQDSTKHPPSRLVRFSPDGSVEVLRP